MSKSVFFALAVEFTLIFLTVLLLLRRKAAKKRAIAGWSSVFFLFITFIWSIISGIVLALNDIYLPL